MNIRKRLEEVERALAPKPRMHVVNLAEWSPEEREAYELAPEDKSGEMLRAHLLL